MIYSSQQRRGAPQSSEYYSPPRELREGNSPTRGSILLQEDCLEYVDSLAGRKQNLKTCLDLYKVSFENSLPQKCFPHNNFITLYCENQQKLLCVNCIYGTAVHKSHRVVPSNHSLKNISRDNEESIKILEDQLQRIRGSEAELGKNAVLLKDEYKRVMDSLDQEFDHMFRMLTGRHKQMKERAMEAFTRANENTQIGKEEASWWKNYLGSLRHSLPKSSEIEEVEIYKHLVLETLKKEKLDMEKLTYIASPQEITEEFISQATALREAVENRIIGSKPVKTKAERIKLF